MAAAESSNRMAKEKTVMLSGAEQEQTMYYILEKSLESIIHNLVVEVHRSEKAARTQSAVVELQQKAEKIIKIRSQAVENGTDVEEDAPVETNAAIWKDGVTSLKGNPMKTVKNVLCPNCRLPRLMYPRVGFNSRPPPDLNVSYCKNEPAIILDKHDVHGQRKKGVKMKGQPKNKNKKKAEAASPAPSENSDALTPSTSSFPADSFEFKEIEYPAAKCPNKDSHLGDHWKAVNVFATHLNGSCWLKRDRAAGREAVAKMSGTPKDSRASSPKLANGVKRARPVEDSEGNWKKKQKIETTPKKIGKANGAPSKLREDASIADSEEPPSASQREDSQALDSAISLQDEGQIGLGLSKKITDTEKRAKMNGVAGTTAKKKPTKPNKKS